MPHQPPPPYQAQYMADGDETKGLRGCNLALRNQLPVPDNMTTVNLDPETCCEISPWRLNPLPVASLVT